MALDVTIMTTSENRNGKKCHPDIESSMDKGNLMIKQGLKAGDIIQTPKGKAIVIKVYPKKIEIYYLGIN